MKILLVEDDPALHEVMRHSLLALGRRVEGATSLGSAQHWWRVQPFDAVLLDLNLPDGSGLTALREFSGNVAHKFRTPLSGICLQAERALTFGAEKGFRNACTSCS